MGEQIRKGKLEITDTGQAICEAMLEAYKDLDLQIDLLADTSRRKGANSFNKDVYKTFDELCKIYNEQIACINVKVIIEQAIEDLTDNSLIVECYVNGTPQKDIAEKLNISSDRLRHRLKWRKRQLFKIILGRYSTAQLFNYISDSKWLMSEFKKQSLRRAKG